MLAVATTRERDGHDTSPGHPEQRERLDACWRGIQAADIDGAILAVPPRRARLDELVRVHPPGYLHHVQDFCAAGGGDLDPDTPVVVDSWDTALFAAGTTIAVVEAVERNDADTGFALIRPPGHHASASTPMGFCLLNNVALAARALTARGERVAIVDWDVHHGNGTQALFWDDPSVLFVSTHLAPHWPFTGDLNETGGANAPGGIINLPLPHRTTGDVLLQAIDELIAPAIETLAATWLLISAGFDSHRRDPLGGLGLTAGDFAAMTRRLGELVPRRVLVLEGGYDLDALAMSVGACAAALVGANYAPEEQTSGGRGAQSVASAVEMHRIAVNR